MISEQTMLIRKTRKIRQALKAEQKYAKTARTCCEATE